MENMYYYNRMRSVPKDAQKTIPAGKLKGYTNITPQWRIATLTEVFGPCGKGWWTEVTDKRLVPVGDTGEVYCFVDILLYVMYEGEVSQPIFGTGGNCFIASTKNGLQANDECFKSAYTDAISVAAKSLGCAADIYYKEDRTKYDSNYGDAAPVFYGQPAPASQAPQAPQTQYAPQPQRQMQPYAQATVQPQPQPPVQSEVQPQPPQYSQAVPQYQQFPPAQAQAPQYQQIPVAPVNQYSQPEVPIQPQPQQEQKTVPYGQPMKTSRIPTTIEEARAVVFPDGANKGKTVGEVAISSMNTIEYYLNKTGPDYEKRHPEIVAACRLIHSSIA